MPDKITLQELQPIIDLMTTQEERIVKKIDGVHGHVISISKDVKAQNGRVRKNTEELIRVKDHCELKDKTCGADMKKALPALKTMKRLNIIVRHPFKTAMIFLGVMVSLQVVVMNAYHGGWLDDIWSTLKLLILKS